MRVGQVWRYPVKSLGGERLTVATVDALGIEGDRTGAVRPGRAALGAREVGNTLGVYAAVETPGPVRVGDEARWLD